ncbi:hypothetical protein GCM10007977_097480 [Dactylosporangium sucinum]|uniref:Uncharacterized protein n=1 Tax=Dactylosporangium sucinum TaxID=1424081 RepID=A0A917UCE6_9ACTN|nr:hypothetical protein GCM10007977_097480 [Dactylosporangium sucinum]
MLRISQVRTVSPVARDRSTSAATSPAVRARTARRAAGIDWACTPTTRSATPGTVVAGGPARSWAPNLRDIPGTIARGYDKNGRDQDRAR